MISVEKYTVEGNLFLNVLPIVNLHGSYVYVYILFSTRAVSDEMPDSMRNTSFCQCFADALRLRKANSQLTDHSSVFTEVCNGTVQK